MGTGYQYKVVYRDRRFSDLDRLVKVHSGTLPVAGDEGPASEQRLYELVMVMIKEGRLPKTFQVLSTKGAESDKLASMVEELRRSLGELGGRVRKLEEQLAAQDEVEDEQQGPAEALAAETVERLGTVRSPSGSTAPGAHPIAPDQG